MQTVLVQRAGNNPHTFSRAHAREVNKFAMNSNCKMLLMENLPLNHYIDRNLHVVCNIFLQFLTDILTLFW